MIWIIIGAVIVVVGLVVVALGRRRNADGVATFQRQIDALSPEARRPVVDQVQQLEDEQAPPDPDEPGEDGVPDGP